MVWNGLIRMLWLLFVVIIPATPTQMTVSGAMVEPPSAIPMPWDGAHGLMQVQGILTDINGNPMSKVQIVISFQKIWGLGEPNGTAIVSTDSKGWFYYQMVVEESIYRFRCYYDGNPHYAPCEASIEIKTYPMS